MIELKIAVDLICGILMAWGGYNFKVARRFFLPTLLSVFCCILLHSFWPLTMILAMVALSLGYGDNSVFSHIFGHSWGRSVYGVLVAICLSLPLFLTHHFGPPLLYTHTPVATQEAISYVVLFLYLALNFTLENALKDINQIIGDIIIGIAFGSIVFLIH